MKEYQDQCRAAFVNCDYRKFLSMFKTHPCPYQGHSSEFCVYYHPTKWYTNAQGQQAQKDQTNQHQIINQDKRRNPYGKLNRILYKPEYCQKIADGCQNEECSSCNNIWQITYHPLIFKTIDCAQFYDCSYSFCDKIHYSDYVLNPKMQTLVLRFSEFFRFDIMVFKSIQCNKECAHDKNFCIYYHNQKDYRRPNFESYDHIQCTKFNIGGCGDMNCPNSHNKIEQLYHPSRYKSKYCEKHQISRKNASDPNNDTTFKSLCPYGKFCSFAHDQSQVSFELIDKMQKNLEFHLYSFKTVWCPIISDHNRWQCVYAHNIQDYRRNPKQYYYEPVQCPFWKKNDNIKSIQNAGCPDGMSCTKCHGWKEKEFHPIIYCKNKSNDYKAKQKTDNFTCSEGGKQKNESPYLNDKKKSSMILKKLGTQFNTKSNLQTIVQTIYNKSNPQKQLYAPGTPFFKNNNPNKIKSQSQKGDGGKGSQTQKIKQVQEKGSTKSIALKSQSNAPNVEKDPNDYEDIDDTLLFKAFQSGNQQTCDQKRSCINLTEKNDSEYGKEQHITQKAARTISKSVGCNSRQHHRNMFSKDMTEILTSQILDILRFKNISQIKLINMKQGQIRKIQELTNSQKSLIIKKVLHARDNAKKTPTYQDILEKHFIKHKRQQILSKMKSKKVKQQKLLLLDSQIRQLSFLSESQKRILPKIIEQFKDNKQFQQLSVDIANTIKCNGAV